MSYDSWMIFSLKTVNWYHNLCDFFRKCIIYRNSLHYLSIYLFIYLSTYLSIQTYRESSKNLEERMKKSLQDDCKKYNCQKLSNWQHENKSKVTINLSHRLFTLLSTFYSLYCQKCKLVSPSIASIESFVFSASTSFVSSIASFISSATSKIPIFWTEVVLRLKSSAKSSRLPRLTMKYGLSLI